MSTRKNLMGVALLGQAAWDAVVHQRFIRRVTSIVLLAVAAGVTATIALAGLLYCLYRLLVRYGVDADVAAAMVSGATALFALVLVMIVIRRVRDFRRTKWPPVVSHLRDVVGAFMDGFMKSH